MRRALALLLALAAATPASITGHAKLDEIARYTKAAEQKRLARAAIGRLPGADESIGLPNLGERFGRNAKKDNEIRVDFVKWRAGQDETANTYIIEIAI